MVCQFCLRPVRHSNLRRVCGSCRRTGRNICIFCALPYHSNHTCSLNLPRCANCHQPTWLQRLALPLNAGQRRSGEQEMRLLCGSCKSKGFLLCHRPGCLSIAKNPGKLVYCDSHHPLPASSLWRKGILPIGGPPMINSRSWRSWGVELECYVERGVRVRDDWTPPPGWNKGSDGSITPPYRTQTAEFRSPPFYGDRGLAQLVRDVWEIKRAGWGGVNKSCGSHLHIDLGAMDEEDLKAIFRFAKAYESQIFELVAFSRRDNSFCKKLGARINMRDRYRWANFSALNEFGTLEVRLHQGSVHPIRLMMWVRLMLRFVEIAIRLGRQRGLPKRGLFDVLNLSARERVYWKARKERFIRDQQRREQQAQAAQVALVRG